MAKRYKMGFKQRGLKDEKEIRVSQERGNWRALVIMAMKI
jgi:hypothetical protein